MNVKNKVKKLIIYGSCYGSAKQYACRFAQMTGIDVISYNEIDGYLDYDLIIYFGALYAGGLKGLKKSIKKMKRETRQIIVSVGLANIRDEKTKNHIKLLLLQQLPDYFLDSILFFHLRGKIDYQNLHIIHKIMMKMLFIKVKYFCFGHNDADTQLFLHTYGKKVDFTDFKILSIIKDELNHL